MMYGDRASNRHSGDACGETMMTEVRKLHATLFKCSYDMELFTFSALVHAYLKVGFLDEAEKVFVHLPEWDVVLWNVMRTATMDAGRIAVLDVGDGVFEVLVFPLGIHLKDAEVALRAANDHMECDDISRRTLL